MVASDLADAIEKNRFPLVISERREHLSLLAQAFDQKLAFKNVKAFTLVGGMSKKARAEVLAQITATVGTETRPYIMATGSFIGEGFDLPALDTLIIAMPVSFKGKMIQYAGRLHRAHAGKSEALIYDYLDSSSALTVSMFRKRLTAYKMMGYKTDFAEGGRSERGSRIQTRLFAGDV